MQPLRKLARVAAGIKLTSQEAKYAALSMVTCHRDGLCVRVRVDVFSGLGPLSQCRVFRFALDRDASDASVYPQGMPIATGSGAMLPHMDYTKQVGCLASTLERLGNQQNPVANTSRKFACGLPE